MSRFKPLFPCILSLALAPLAQAQECSTVSEIPSSTPTGDFIDHGDGTVTHKKSGLMWLKCPLGQRGDDCATGSANTYTWQGALDIAHSYSFAGYDDWRLPNVKELFSIVERRCYAPAVNLEVFPATDGSDFWTASPSSVFSDFAWYVDAYSGKANDYNREYVLKVRLVRSGQ